MSDDMDAFWQEMQDVTPHKSSNKVSLKRGSEQLQAATAELRQQNAQQSEQQKEPELALEPMIRVLPNDILSFNDGIGNNVFNRFRKGQYPIEASLDLHRMRVKQARDQVLAFIKECMRLQIRTALICHGKAEFAEQKATLKSCVNHWLQELTDVQAFHSAQLKHGGTGSVYVMLRKSEAKKLENRLHYNKGRVE